MRDCIGDWIDTTELGPQWLIKQDLTKAFITQILAVCRDLPATVGSGEAETKVEQSIVILNGLGVQIGVGADVLFPDVGIFRAHEPLEVA